MTPLDEFIDGARHWARQTVIFALQYRDDDSEDARDWVARTNDESLEIVNRLWGEASGEFVEPAAVVRHFVWLVLDWTAKNLPRCEEARR
jgi:hypothetical protein